MPSQTVQEKLAALRERLAEDAESLQTRLTIYSISVSKNDKGETVTRMLLDAQLRIASLAEDATAQEEAKRSEERRGGKEWVRTGRSRWSPSHIKKKEKQKK